MIVGGRYARRFQAFRQVLGPGAASHIHDAAAFHPGADAPHLPYLILRLAHDVAQVGALETGTQEVLFREFELFHDIPGHEGRSGGGKGYHRRIHPLA